MANSPVVAGSDVEVHSTHHIVPLSVYFAVFAGLMVLLVTTVVAAMFDLGPLNTVIALTIAVMKALLIMIYFMHLKYSSRLTWVFAGVAFLWLVIMFVFTFCDYTSRGWMPITGT